MLGTLGHWDLRPWTETRAGAGPPRGADSRGWGLLPPGLALMGPQSWAVSQPGLRMVMDAARPTDRGLGAISRWEPGRGYAGASVREGLTHEQQGDRE